MSYPNYPPAPPQQPGYPPQQPSYPPQPPPSYPPQQPQYPAQQGYPQYPPQGQYPPPPPAQPLPRSTVADFYDQPAGGAKPLQFPDRAYGTKYTVMIARPVSDADIQVQTDKQGQPRRFRDGSLMKVMVLPLMINPTAEYPDGTASFYVKGNDTAELNRAMAEAGVPPQQIKLGPEQYAILTIEYTHDRPVPGGFNPAKMKRITYDRSQVRNPMPPQQAAPPQNGQASAPPVTAVQPPPPAQPQASAAQPLANYQPPGFPQGTQPAPPPVPPAQPQQVAAQTPQAPAQPVPQAPPVPPMQPAPQMAPPPGMDEQNKQLLAQLIPGAQPQ